MFSAKQIFFFLLGGLTYCIIEILWRGRTHPSMFIAGGLCLIAIYAIYSSVGKRSLLLSAPLCGAAITAVEMAVGLVVNVNMGLKVWDYSAVPYNIMGQVCLPYTLMWIGLSIPAMYICRFTDRTLFNTKTAERSE